MKDSSGFFNRNGEQIKLLAASFHAPCIALWMCAMFAPVIWGFSNFFKYVDSVDSAIAPLSLVGGFLVGGLLAYITFPLLAIPRLIYGFGELVSNSYNKCDNGNTVEETVETIKTEVENEETTSLPDVNSIEPFDSEAPLENSPTHNEKIDATPDWDDLVSKQGSKFGRCSLCGKKQHLVYVEFEDHFGKGQGELCPDCFEKKCK